ncbi:hypothetical protein [Ruegeria arenilitoris]|uniref:hypothetical protein n=1 Tax=Ruegeria arenilitoris TaxID=1173585 RepID=UPI00147E66FB|nr:hypothetical protein [Ruegeria arenilitoris]
MRKLPRHIQRAIDRKVAATGRGLNKLPKASTQNDDPFGLEETENSESEDSSERERHE